MNIDYSIGIGMDKSVKYAVGNLERIPDTCRNLACMLKVAFHISNENGDEITAVHLRNRAGFLTFIPKLIINVSEMKETVEYLDFFFVVT